MDLSGPVSVFPFARIIPLFNTVADACREWTILLFDVTGSIPFYLACLSVVLVVRFLLKPIIGEGLHDASGSDKAKKAKKDKGGKK